ncbi:MAG: translesion error-prone DNA polymerase V autoproteolytic subunit [Pseudomonadota bacterium]
MPKIYALSPDNRLCPLPLYGSKISAGFPSPADEYVGDTLDLNEYLIHNKTATFFVQVEGHSMIMAGINEGDLLIVDRSVPPRHQQIVIALVDDEFTVKRLDLSDGLKLLAENSDYPPIVPTGDDQVAIWGVVTAVVRKL